MAVVLSVFWRFGAGSANNQADLQTKAAADAAANCHRVSFCRTNDGASGVIYVFGQVSLVGILANLHIVALIPLAMLLSLIAGLAGMLIGNVAGWFAWPANVLLTYMLDVAGLLCRIPHVFLQNRYLSAADMVLCYLGVVLVVLVLAQRSRKRTDWQAVFVSLKQRPTKRLTDEL